MLNQIQGFTITNTGSSPNREGGRYPAAVRVKLWGRTLAEVFPPCHQPLVYVRKHPKSKYTQSLIGQLKAQGVADETIASLLQNN